VSPLIQEKVESLLRQAHIRLRRKDVGPARDLATEALALDPSSPAGHEMLGLTLEADGDDIAAYRQFRAACSFGEAVPAAEQGLARLAGRLPAATLALLLPKLNKNQDLPDDVKSRLPPEALDILAMAATIRPAPRQGPAKIRAFASLIIPGLGQYLNGHHGKAIIMALLWAICLMILAASDFGSHGHINPGDPFIWGPSVVLVIDYLASILDASMATVDQSS
jgi:phage tail protein X